MYHVFTNTPTLTNLQRCFFPSNIPSDHYGKWAFLTTNCENKYFLKICVQPQLKGDVCVLDDNVQYSPRQNIRRQETVIYDRIQLVPSIKFIKTVNIEIVFTSIWDLQKWIAKNVFFKSIVKQILELFVLVDDLVICVKDLHDINKLGIHTIIIKNVGNIPAGKIVESSKVEIDNVTCFDRYSVKQNKNFSSIPLLKSQHSVLKDLLVSFKKCSLSSTPISSALKALIIGPDGCGKKTLVKSIAAECEAVLITIDGPELCRPQPGETENLLKQKFDETVLHSKEGIVILLLLRVESICGGRVSSKLLHLLDTAPVEIAVVATTAKPNLLSKAASSRFTSRIFINTPAEDERCEMIRVLSDNDLSHEAAIELARKTPGFVVADLKLLISKAKRSCRLNNSTSSEEDLRSAVNKCLYQVEGSAVRGELGLVKAEKFDMQELGGLAEVKRILTQSIVWPLLHPLVFSTFNIQRPSGVLLYGPPGCAKTSLARAIASSSELTFLSVSAADLLSPYVGDAEQTLTSLFQRARDASPALLFIDEIDSLVGSRGDKHRGAQERLLSTFLVEMDGIGVKAEAHSNSVLEAKVTVIGATNRPDCVDPALLRPGRLDRLIYVPPPALEDRLEILSLLTKHVPLGECVDLKYIAEHTNLYSGADLKHLCQEAGLQALTHDGMDASVVRQEHWLAALRETPPSLSIQQLEFYTNFSFS